MNFTWIQNQYTQNGAPTLLSAFDAGGNLTSDGQGKTFTWTGENRLATVSAATQTLECTYDAMGLRVCKVVENQTETTIKDWQYFYDGWNLLYEIDDIGTEATRYYVWGLIFFNPSKELVEQGGVF